METFESPCRCLISDLYNGFAKARAVTVLYLEERTLFFRHNIH